jgi:hypothetical protein
MTIMKSGCYMKSIESLERSPCERTARPACTAYRKLALRRCKSHEIWQPARPAVYGQLVIIRD